MDVHWAIVGAILFLAYKDRLATEFYYLRRRLFWKPLRAWQRRRANMNQKGGRDGR